MTACTETDVVYNICNEVKAWLVFGTIFHELS
jgi:hypothetical protein